MALGSTQPLVKMSTKEYLLWVKAAGAWRWQPHHLHVPNVMVSGNLNLLEPSGPHWACYGTPPFTIMVPITKLHGVKFRNMIFLTAADISDQWWHYKRVLTRICVKFCIVFILTILPFVWNGDSVHLPSSCQTILLRTYQPKGRMVTSKVCDSHAHD